MAQPVSPEISVLANADAMSHEAARFVLLSTREAVLCTGRCTVALSGGSTPRRLYELLASDEYRGAMPWDEIEWFWSDAAPMPVAPGCTTA
ncbi:MAG: 6-phosphogluconolactonase, partial [Gemmatimonadota bacterium]